MKKLELPADYIEITDAEIENIEGTGTFDGVIALAKMAVVAPFTALADYFQTPKETRNYINSYDKVAKPYIVAYNNHYRAKNK
jgi:hypothetical protein